MGKKINPKILRMGITRKWHSSWFATGKDYILQTKQDVLMRKYLLKFLRESGLDRVEVDRSSDKIKVSLFSAKPGLIIGKGGTGVEDLKKRIHNKFLKNFKLNQIDLSINEVKKPNLSSQIMLQSIIIDIEKRVHFKRVMKQAINRAERAGASGIKILVSGRLNGAEIARSEKLVSGKLPLQTLRADIDYARGCAATTYGSIGVKVWIYKGEVFEIDSDKTGDVIGESVSRHK